MEKIINTTLYEWLGISFSGWKFRNALERALHENDNFEVEVDGTTVTLTTEAGTKIVCTAVCVELAE
jgi:hypothetical protein